jgi:molybdopterin-guanine dinucleotide biosynthesis protein A
MTTDAPAGLSGVVLCGGHSRRMGRNKAVLTLQGQRLIAHVLDRLDPLCDELIVAANDVGDYADLPARVVPDVLPVSGPLSGIHAGLSSMRNELGIVVACDMPFLNHALLRFMAVVAPGYDVVVPHIQGEYEPLHAVYRRTCIAPIERLLAQGPRRVVALFPLVRVREVTQEEVALFDAENSFFNVNTPEDWAEAQRLSRRRRR